MKKFFWQKLRKNWTEVLTKGFQHFFIRLETSIRFILRFVPKYGTFDKIFLFMNSNSNYNRLEHWVDEQQSKGKLAFSITELKKNFVNDSETALKRVLDRLSKSEKLFLFSEVTIWLFHHSIYQKEFYHLPFSLTDWWSFWSEIITLLY